MVKAEAALFLMTLVHDNRNGFSSNQAVIAGQAQPKVGARHRAPFLQAVRAQDLFVGVRESFIGGHD